MSPRSQYVQVRLCLPCADGECYGCYGGCCRCWCGGNAAGEADAIKALHAAVTSGTPRRATAKSYDALAKERDAIEADLIQALESVERLQAERLRVHNQIGAAIGAPAVHS